jgi:hypothetical protein
MAASACPTILPIVIKTPPVRSAPKITNIFLVFIVWLLEVYYISPSQLYLLRVNEGTEFIIDFFC